MSGSLKRCRTGSIKELRLRRIGTLEEANRFLEESYWAAYNKKFMVKALHKDAIPRAVSRGLKLDRILCIRTATHGTQ